MFHKSRLVRRRFYLTSTLLSPQALNHYLNLVIDTASTFLKASSGGNRLCVLHRVIPDRFIPDRLIAEYTGVRMTHVKAAKLSTQRDAVGVHNGYQLSIADVNVVIDVM